MAERHIPLTMQDWADRLDRFIKMTDREVLNNARKVSYELAKEFAESEFEKYRIIQDHFFESDFDIFISLKNVIEPEKTQRTQKVKFRKSNMTKTMNKIEKLIIVKHQNELRTAIDEIVADIEGE